MKKIMLSFLVATIAASTSMACIGGNLIQIIDKSTNTAIASYDKISGEMRSRSKSHTILKVAEVGKKSNLCVDSACEELVDMKNKDIRITYAEFMSNKRKTVTLKDVTIGLQATAKGLPRAMPANLNQQQDDVEHEISESILILGCSQKN